MRVFVLRGWSSWKGRQEIEETLTTILKGFDVHDVNITVAQLNDSFLLIVLRRDTASEKWLDFPERVAEEQTQ